VNGKESRSPEFFTVVSTVGQIFGATQRECLTTETPSIGNAEQSSETMRNSLGLNYEMFSFLTAAIQTAALIVMVECYFLDAHR
jgi:hypothetical protein